MPTDNVVPIDAEVARAIARRAIRFRWFVAALAAVWLGTLIPVLLFTPLPPLVPFLVLGALLVLAEHRFVLFGDETSMSGSIIVAVASIFVFADSSPLAGPMLVASLGGLYLPHVRQRDVSKIITNAGAMSLAACSASVTTGLNSPTTAIGLTTATASIALATATYWAINNAVVSAYVASRDGTPIGPAFATLVTSDAGVLIWCWLASAIAILTHERPSLELFGVAACVGANALMTRARWISRVTELWERNAFMGELACWAAATLALSATGASQTQVGVLAGTGVGYSLWTRTQTSFAATAGTAVLALLAVGWLNELAGILGGLLGIALLCGVPVSSSTLRSACAITGALAFNAMVASYSGGEALDALGLLVCVLGASVLPQLLATLHERIRKGGVSIATLVGMSIPSRSEAAVALGSYLVVAAFTVDVGAGLLASAMALAPIVWLNRQHKISYQGSAVGAFH